jgi:hypothetical protein
VSQPDDIHVIEKVKGRLFRWYNCKQTHHRPVECKSTFAEMYRLCRDDLFVEMCRLCGDDVFAEMMSLRRCAVFAEMTSLRRCAVFAKMGSLRR